jgi:hypothetical protein
MTLAIILFLSVFFITSAAPLAAGATAGRSAPQAAPTSKPADTTPAPSQGNVSPAPNPPSATQPAQTPSGQNHPTAPKRAPHKKKVATSNCANAAPTPRGSSAPSSDPPSTAPGGAGGSPQTPATPGAPTNCPPSKIIVRQGGTSEPSIQLAGGAGGDQADHQRDTANKMLEATQENLKKIAGRQLSRDQQDMVTQVHQFMDQSKSAVAAGDLERARTLAWKAQLLSEELVSPQK